VRIHLDFFKTISPETLVGLGANLFAGNNATALENTIVAS
jgi:prefoldin subunit 5